MSQKESEWELKLQEKIKENKFVTPSSHLDAEEIKSFIQETLSNRENEIAEEVKKKRKEPTHSGTGSISWYNQALDEVLLIIKK